MDLDRMVTIVKALEDGHGVSIDMLAFADYRRLVEKYGSDCLYLCKMGDGIAIRLHKMDWN